MPSDTEAMDNIILLIQPLSPVGIAVLAIFLVGLAMIVFEVQLDMNKYIPALLMLGSLPLIAAHYYFTGSSPSRFAPFHRLLTQTKETIFSLVAFMAFMWMIVELLSERNVFGALNSALLNKGLKARGMFWAVGLLCVLFSPFLSSITTALVFGKSVKAMSKDPRYTHLMLCNIIIASNAGLWFVGVSTTLMALLAHRVALADLLPMASVSILGWFAGALVLDVAYLHPLTKTCVWVSLCKQEKIKPGGVSLAVVSVLAIAGAVWLNLMLEVDLEFALGFGFALVSLHLWFLKKRRIEIPFLALLQKVEWATLLYYIGILTGVAALEHVGWLAYLAGAFAQYDASLVNIGIGLISCCVDNNVLEAAVLAAKPDMGIDQWALNMLMIAIGGSLSSVGSAPGILAMMLDKSYTFAGHLRFMPALAANFFGTIAFWYLQYKLLGWG